MKKIFFPLFIFLLVFISSKAQTTDPSPYCKSTYGSASYYHGIDKVELKNLSNSTGRTLIPGYMYYNNLNAVQLQADSSYTITLQAYNTDNQTMIRGWIDFDQNHQFEPSEEIINIAKGSVPHATGIIRSSSFHVPSNALSGKTRMRISIGWHFFDLNNQIFKLDSCNTVVSDSEKSSGETEDYDVMINGKINIDGKEILFPTSIYPNPSNDRIIVNISHSCGEFILKIFDLTGRQVFSQYSNGNREFNITGLKSGLYYTAIISRDKKTFRSILIKE